MNDVTHSRNRYRKGPRAFVCLACDRLADSTRASSITCSPACRTWLHRHPERLQSLMANCALFKVRPAMAQESAAIHRLRPDLAERIQAGELENDDVRADVHREFVRRVMADCDGSAEALQETAR